MEERQIRQVDFSKLRHAYIIVKSFLEAESFEKVKSLNTRVAEDLGLYGDYNYDLLMKFTKKFELNHNNFEYDKHFYSEGELFGSGAALINLLNLSVWLPLKTIELLTFNKIKIAKPALFSEKREVTDMTFRDLLTWYIEGDFVAGDEVRYQIKTKPQQDL